MTIVTISEVKALLETCDRIEKFCPMLDELDVRWVKDGVRIAIGFYPPKGVNRASLIGEYTRGDSEPAWGFYGEAADSLRNCGKLIKT